MPLSCCSLSLCARGLDLCVSLSLSLQCKLAAGRDSHTYNELPGVGGARFRDEVANIGITGFPIVYVCTEEAKSISDIPRSRAEAELLGPRMDASANTIPPAAACISINSRPIEHRDSALSLSQSRPVENTPPRPVYICPSGSHARIVYSTQRREGISGSETLGERSRGT